MHSAHTGLYIVMGVSGSGKSCIARPFAKALGLDPSDAAFNAMTPEQAMRFGLMVWKASGASRINNTGVAIVLGD